MRIEIYKLRRTSDGRRGLDTSELVARVEIVGERFRISCADDERREKISIAFNSGVRLVVGDAVKELPRFSDEAIYDTLRWALPDELGLCGVIVEPHTPAALAPLDPANSLTPARDAASSTFGGEKSNDQFQSQNHYDDPFALDAFSSNEFRFEPATVLLDETKINESQPIETKLIPFLKKDLWGYCDAQRNLIVEPKFRSASRFVEGLAIVTLQNGKQIFIDCTGREAIAFDSVFEINLFSEGLALITTLIEQMFVDKAGQTVFAFEPGKVGVGDFKNGLARVAQNPQNREQRIYSQNGTDFRCISYTPPFYTVCLGAKYGFVDRCGKEVVPFVYKFANDFKDGLALVTSGGKFGFVNAAGDEAVAPIYERASDFSCGLACVQCDGRHGFVNENGRETIPCVYEDAASFSENLAPIKINDKW